MKKGLYVINNVQGSVKDGEYTTGLFKGMNEGLGNAMGAIGSAVGGVAGGLIGGGRTSAAGDIIGGLGKAASAIPGPWGAIAGVGLGAISGLTNAAFGVKLNQENINAVNNNIASMNSFQSNAGDFDALTQNFMNQPTSMRFNQDFIGKNGWFNKGATRKYNELVAQQDAAQQFVDNSLINNMNNITTTQNQNLLANYAAFGGSLSSHGADWNTGLNYVGNGGSHESNPYDGVPMGIAPDGLPNLVEEGEVIWNNDYVFSKRLKVPGAVRRKYKLGGPKPLSFAEAVMQVNKEAEERPNDPITLRGRDAILGVLAEAQDLQRARKETRQQQQDAMMMQEMQPMMAANGGAIHIDKNKRGTFTAAASKHGKSVQEFASQVLANPDNYSPAMRKKANFARNAAKWHSNGGHLYADAGWLDNYTNWWNSRHSLDEELANEADQRVNWEYMFPLPPVASGSVIHSPIRFTEDGNNLSKDVMNWYAEQWRRGTGLSSGKNPYFIANKRYNPDGDFYNEFWDFRNKYGNKDLKGEEQLRALLDAANKGKKGPISNGIQALYDKWKNSGQDFTLAASPSDLNSTILPQTLLSPATLTNPTSRYPILNAANNLNTTIQNSKTQPTTSNSGNNRTGSSWLTGLRYAPVVGSALSVFGDLLGITNKPDYSSADAILEASKGIRDVSFRPIGDYMAYNPFDRMFYLNQLNANAGASRRALANQSAGNRGTAMAGILASDNNMMNSIGQIARQAEEYNLAQRQKVADFNRATNMFNSEGFLKAQQANQGASEVRMRAAQAAAAMRDAIDQRIGTAKSLNLTNLFNNLGDIGWEEFNRNMVNSSPYLDYILGRNGILGYKSKSKGGQIITKKKGAR